MPWAPIKLSALSRSISIGALLFALVALAAIPARGEVLPEVTSCPPPAAALGTSPTDPIIACSGSFSIPKSTFDHWMQVAVDGTASGKGRAVVPDPPLYRECVSHLEADSKAKHGRPAPTKAQLKGRCASNYRTLQREVLGFLLSSAWVLDEARALKLEISEAEARQRFLKIRDQQFPKPREFTAFLRSSGQTVTDLIFRVKLNLLSQRIQAHVVAAAPSTETKQQATSQFVKEFETKWKSATQCLPAYDVADCGIVVDSL